MEESMWAWIGKVGSRTAEQEAMQNAISEIETASDRSAAIVAAAFVEDHLAIALKACFHQDETIIRETFRSTGPLGSFSAKINFAFLIGLCSKETCKDLNIIKEIRNEFAHKVLTKDFDSQRVRDLANNLTFGEKFEITITHVGSDELPLQVLADPPQTARHRYLRACQMLMMFFTFTNRSHPAPPTPEV